jgi:hypothetical protein
MKPPPISKRRPKVTEKQAAALKVGDPIWVWHHNDWLKATFREHKTDSFPYYIIVDLKEPAVGGPEDFYGPAHIERRDPARNGSDKPAAL